MQNWNNIINFLKINTGTKISNLEITDDEFIEYFKETTLPYFSQIIPKHAWITVTSSDNKFIENTYSEYTYELKIPNNIKLIDVSAVYFNNSESYNTLTSGYVDPINVVMNNTLNDIINYLQSVNDFEFIQPNILKFSEYPGDYLIVEVNVEHTDLRSIPSDTYHKLFKQMCLADGLEMIINNRNKFTNLTTPFGQIDLNIDTLQNKLENLRMKIDDIVDGLPHREYLVVI